MTEQRAILITGAAGGVGRALIDLCSRRGDLVLAADFNAAALEVLASANVIPLPIDVADDASVRECFAKLLHHLAGRPLHAVVHAAAIAPLGSVEFTPVGEFDRVHNINTLGAVRILQSALPLLRGHNGRIILISSLLGRTSSAMVSPYASSKHAVEAIGDSARRESHGQNVHVVIAEPGVIQTSMFTRQTEEMEDKIKAMKGEEERLYGDVYRGYLKVFESSAKTATPADKCAAKLMKIIDAPRPKPRYRIGLDAKIVVKLAQILPDRWLDAIFARALGLK